MKKLTFTFLGLLLVMGSFAQTWSYVSLTGTTFILYGMSFPPGQSTIGYACGMQYTYDADGVIVKTTDGGDNWTQIWPATGTIDGLQGIWFISDTEGFACGWNNYFIKTTDGGTTWTPVTCGSNVWYYKDVEFWDANNGVAVASMNATASSAFITSDGGNTWVPATSGMTTNAIMGISYAAQDTIYGCGTDATVYWSTDGGHNWSVKSTLPAMLFGLDFANTDFGVVGGEEKMFATNDGGATWTTYTTGYENFYACMAYPNGTGYIGGTDENIYVTTDFGVNWQFEHNGAGTSHLYRIRETSSGALFACGSQGTIITRAPILAASFTADNTEICLGDAVNFTDLSTGAVTSWNWTFEGGTPPTSTLQNPVVTYNTTGTFDVTLEVGDGTLTNTYSEPDYIDVSDIPAQANTPVGPIEVCEGESVDYTTDPVALANSYDWVVTPADAGTISGTGTTATFLAATNWTGAFAIKVRATNDCGDGVWSPDLSCTLNDMPMQFSLMGGGTVCEGDPGVDVYLDGSETGIDYELYLDAVSTGNIVAGTGSSISFGLQTIGGTYTAMGFTSTCSIDMMEQVIVIQEFLPGVASAPYGPTELCGNGDSTEYNTDGASGATSYNWLLSPPEAGTLTPYGQTATVDWNVDFSGMAYISVQGVNDCGEGLYSDELEITVYAPPVPEVSGETEVCDNTEEIYMTTENPGNTYSWEVSQN